MTGLPGGPEDLADRFIVSARQIQLLQHFWFEHEFSSGLHGWRTLAKPMRFSIAAPDIDGPQGDHLCTIEPQAPQALQHLRLEEPDPPPVELHDDGKGAVRSQDDVVYHAGVVRHLQPQHRP